MSYEYSKLRDQLFTEEGSILYTSIRDHVRKILPTSGAITMGSAISGPKQPGSIGDSWAYLACVDRMLELGELREIPQGEVAAQNRVFVAGHRAS